MATTYRQLAEKIQTTYYRGIASDQSTYSLRHIAQLCAEEIASAANRNAIEKSNMGETTYANDTFITTYTNLPVVTDSALKVKYVTLPATPTALPNNQEVQAIWPYGSRKVQIMPIKNKDRFAQNYLDPIPGVVMYYIQNNTVVFDNTTMFDFGAVNMNLVGAMPANGLMDAVINCPKSYEAMISERVIARMAATSGKPRVTIESNEGEPA